MLVQKHGHTYGLDVGLRLRLIRPTALILIDSVGVRGEFQAIRAEARADREAMRTDREVFESHILRLTEQQGIHLVRLDEGRDRTSSVGE